jgi:pyruvate/2-oxoacid:ferredoxin oxidoreductase alpha subunit
MIRPFPVDEVVGKLRGRKAVAVFDQNLAPGSGGILYPEVVSALYHERRRPSAILPVIGGLGGTQMTPREMESIFEEMRASRDGGARPKTIHMFREDELEKVNRALATAKGGSQR